MVYYRNCLAGFVLWSLSPLSFVLHLKISWRGGRADGPLGLPRIWNFFVCHQDRPNTDLPLNATIHMFFFLWLSLLFFKQTWDSKTEHLRKQDLQVKNIYCTWYTAIYRYRYTLYNRLQWTEPLSSGGSLLSLFLSKDMAQLGHRRITLAMGFATLVVNEVGCWYDQFRRLGPICQLKNRIAPTWYGIYIYIRIYTYGNQHIVGMQWMETLSNKSGFWNFEYRWPLTGDL